MNYFIVGGCIALRCFRDDDGNIAYCEPLFQRKTPHEIRTALSFEPVVNTDALVES